MLFVLGCCLILDNPGKTHPLLSVLISRVMRSHRLTDCRHGKGVAQPPGNKNILVLNISNSLAEAPATSGAMFVNDINCQCCQLQWIYGFCRSKIGIKLDAIIFTSWDITDNSPNSRFNLRTIPDINEWPATSNPSPPALPTLRNKITDSSLTSNFPTNIN